MIAVVAVAAVFGGQRATPASEQDWLIRWGQWEERARPDVNNLGLLTALSGPDRNEIARAGLAAARRLRDCEAFATSVPVAPRRFVAGQQATERFCRSAPRVVMLAGDTVARRKHAQAAFNAQYGLLTNRFFEARRAVRDRLVFSRALPVASGPSPRSRVEPVLGKLTTRLAGSAPYERYDVRCWSDREWPLVVREEYAFYGRTAPKRLMGFLDLAPSRALGHRVYETLYLSSPVCDPIAQYAYGSRPAPTALELATALQVVARHAKRFGPVLTTRPESEDFANYPDTLECVGLQHTAQAARLLGASHASARRLALLAWEKVYPSLPARYRSPECRPRGRLDETPYDGVWP